MAEFPGHGGFCRIKRLKANNPIFRSVSIKSFGSETLADRITRLLGPSLKSPEKTRELLERLSDASRETPQPRNHDPDLKQPSLFEAQ